MGSCFLCFSPAIIISIRGCRVLAISLISLAILAHRVFRRDFSAFCEDLFESIRRRGRAQLDVESTSAHQRPTNRMFLKNVRLMEAWVPCLPLSGLARTELVIEPVSAA